MGKTKATRMTRKRIKAKENKKKAIEGKKKATRRIENRISLESANEKISYILPRIIILMGKTKTTRKHEQKENTHTREKEKAIEGKIKANGCIENRISLVSVNGELSYILLWIMNMTASIVSAQNMTYGP